MKERETSRLVLKIMSLSASKLVFLRTSLSLSMLVFFTSLHNTGIRHPKFPFALMVAKLENENDYTPNRAFLYKRNIRQSLSTDTIILRETLENAILLKLDNCKIYIGIISFSNERYFFSR